jgi:hypothetical protein
VVRCYNCFRSNRRIQWNKLDNISWKFKHSKSYFSWSRYFKLAGLAFGGEPGSPPFVTVATEEWTGAGVALTQTITVS